MVSVLEDCINWYYLNLEIGKGRQTTVLEDCINWYYLNFNLFSSSFKVFLRIVLIGII